VVTDPSRTRRSGPLLSVRAASGRLAGSVLVLHGGQEVSRAPVTPRQLPVLRMVPIAAAVHRRVARLGVQVVSLQFAVRGWNGEEASPVADARWALDRIRERAGGPVVVIGHSMGGRTAMRVGGEPDVRGVVGLAPWLPPGEPVQQLAGRRILIGHGTLDRITSPIDSQRFLQRARDVAESVEYVPVPGEGHALLLRAGTWNRLAVRGVREGLGLA
jgi:alpha-beta hydrolase superfamily lysophospholipase